MPRLELGYSPPSKILRMSNQHSATVMLSIRDTTPWVNYPYPFCTIDFMLQTELAEQGKRRSVGIVSRG
jgi:hypothetical protein